jgi:hypothetical protein
VVLAARAPIGPVVSRDVAEGVEEAEDEVPVGKAPVTGAPFCEPLVVVEGHLIVNRVSPQPQMQRMTLDNPTAS